MKVSDMKKGQTVTIDGVLYVIVDYQHVKLGKGGAVYQTKFKNLVDGGIRDIRLRAEETIDEAFLENGILNICTQLPMSMFSWTWKITTKSHWTMTLSGTGQSF